jgi:hypothetical protein
MSEEYEVAFDFNDGDFYARPATLRRIADELEALGKANVKMIEYASDSFTATWRLPNEGQLDQDQLQEDDDEDKPEYEPYLDGD